MAIMEAINKKRKKKGFTLVELVIDVAILAILAVIAVPRFTEMTEKANASTFEANHRIIVSAIAEYTIDNFGGTIDTDMKQLAPYISDLQSVGNNDVAAYFAGKPSGATYVWDNGVLTSTLKNNGGFSSSFQNSVGERLGSLVDVNTYQITFYANDNVAVSP